MFFCFYSIRNIAPSTRKAIRRPSECSESTPARKIPRVSECTRINPSRSRSRMSHRTSSPTIRSSWVISAHFLSCLFGPPTPATDASGVAFDSHQVFVSRRILTRHTGSWVTLMHARHLQQYRVPPSLRLAVAHPVLVHSRLFLYPFPLHRAGIPMPEISPTPRRLQVPSPEEYNRLLHH